MSRLRISEEHGDGTATATFTAHADIARELGAVEVCWSAGPRNQAVAPGASQDEVVAAYRADIDRLMREEGYRTVDVVSSRPDHPDRPRCARSSSASTRMPRTRCASSWPVRASSPCTSANGSTTFSANRAT